MTLLCRVLVGIIVKKLREIPLNLQYGNKQLSKAVVDF